MRGRRDPETPNSVKAESAARTGGTKGGRGGAWALRKFMGKVELSEEPGGGWGRREGQTPISQLLLRWPGESASEAEA